LGRSELACKETYYPDYLGDGIFPMVDRHHRAFAIALKARAAVWPLYNQFDHLFYYYKI
jgi:hypothetical protein